MFKFIFFIFVWGLKHQTATLCATSNWVNPAESDPCAWALEHVGNARFHDSNPPQDLAALRERLSKDSEVETAHGKVTPISSQVHSGNLNQVMTLNRTPLDFKSYFDNNGRFHYKRQNPILPLPASGAAPIKSIRVGYSNEGLLYGERSEALINDLLKALPKLNGAELWITHVESDKSKVDALLAQVPPEIRSRVKLITSGDPTEHIRGRPYFSVKSFIHDASKPISGNRVLVPRGAGGRPLLGRDETNNRILLSLQRQNILKLEMSPFRWEGGNIISGERHTLVGSDVVEDLMKDVNVSRTEALDALGKEFGRPAIEIPLPRETKNEEEVVLHIDLQMALVKDRKTGKEVALVESGRQIFEKELGFPRLETLSEAQFQELLKKKIAEWATQPGMGKNPSRGAQQFITLLPNLRLHDILYREVLLDNIVERMQKQGYAVERLPGMSQVAMRNNGVTLDIFNYTNGLFSENVALVAEMGIPFMDQAAYAIYRKLGYEIVPMSSSQGFLSYLGGTNCLSEVLRGEIVNPDGK